MIQRPYNILRLCFPNQQLTKTVSVCMERHSPNQKVPLHEQCTYYMKYDCDLARKYWQL